jgi:hypothetical protein
MKMKKRTLFMVSAITIGMLAISVTGALIEVFGTITVTANVGQAVKLDGHMWNEPIIATYNTMGGCCFCEEHQITNKGCNGVWLDFDEYGKPDLEGITIHYYYPESEEPPCCEHILDSVVVTALDGQAQWDSYDIYVNEILVGNYTAVEDGGIENWVTTTFDLTSFNIQCCGTHTIKIDCVNGPWTYFNPYGQLAVDSVALYCESDCDQCQPVLCDSVDIGNPSSEANHVMIGWGPIEPATSGGGYGGISDCRTTWFYEDSQTDASWATIELTCEDCYDIPDGDGACPECGEGKEIVFPIYLEPDSFFDLCICYEFDVLILPGVYEITSKLIPVPEPQAP